MSTATRPLTLEATGEIGALIEVLRSTEDRLAELTAGEINSVASRDGRTLLLRLAQEKSRKSGWANQSAILNSLPANVALLDTRGVIIAVNRAWNAFSDAEGFLGSARGVGVDYLAVCDNAHGDGAIDAQAAAIGIRQVLSGERPSYELTYACHSPMEQRWFQMTVTALSDRQQGAVVMHANVTARSRLERAVLESEQYFHFLDDLAQATRALLDPEQVMAVMTRMLGEHLQVSRCAYADVETDSDRFNIVHDYTDGCASTVGKYHLSLFGTRAAATLRAGQTLVIRDVRGEIALGDGSDMFDAIDIKAIITCPLIKDGGLRAMMAVHQTTPREWTTGEIALIQEVVERCWSAIERRTTEEKLRATDGMLRMAGRTARLGGWAVEVTGQNVSWSDEVCNILEVPTGLQPTLEEALSFYCPASEVIVTRALNECLRAGTTFDLELEMITAKGHSIWVRCTGEPQRNGAGTITQVLGAFQDITEHKRAATVLEKSVEEFRTLAESMPQIVWITRPDGWCVYFNQHWMSYTGKTLEESLGNEWLEVFHPDDRQRTWAAWQLATTTRAPYTVESRLRGADGSYRWWLMRGVPLADASGVILKWFGTCTDVHDLKAAELAIEVTNRALRESERRFSKMLGDVQLVSVMLDATGLITYCNDFFLRLTGFEREAVIGRQWFDLFVPENTQDLREVFKASLVDPPKTWHRENEILTRTGERRLIRWNISVLRSVTDHVIGTASIGEDITERVRAEVNIRHLNRVYSMLSSINGLIVRVRDCDELFKEACRIAVEAGGFRMAMVCVVDPATLLPIVVASAGKEDALLSELKEILASREDSAKTMVARTMKARQAIVSNDSQKDGAVLLPQRYVKAGVRSIAVLPLIVADKVMGVIALYADETEFFHREEMKLLTDLTNDIAFAIDYIEKSERLHYLAYHDSLTGLANRTLFHERLTQAVLDADREHRKLALVFVDLERFKTVNASFGREAGDTLLKEVSNRMASKAMNADGLARLDADHFAGVITHLQTAGEVGQRIEHLFNEILRPTFQIGDLELHVSAKVGIAMFPDDGADADTLIKNAEAALKNAKAGSERYMFYAHSMNERAAEKLALEHQLRRALENEEFVLHYQPKISLAGGSLTGCEALIRWNDPITGLVPPGKFIPVLEETGLILEVGRWALRQAIADYARWRSAGMPACRRCAWR
ncbi:MAG: PAS domain S-box protein [Pseudomonadota bacterium]